jgi:hypothetical protein
MRFVAALVVIVAVAACSAATPPAPTSAPATVTGPNPDTDVFGNSRVKVTATTSGVSQTFTVTSGTYAIQYLIDAGEDNGCTFSLILATAKDSPIVQSTSAILPTKAEGAGDVRWTMSAGTYLLQEDETGLAGCQRGFQAMVTAQN